MSRHDDHPLSIFREALASVFGRMLAFVVYLVRTQERRPLLGS